MYSLRTFLPRTVGSARRDQLGAEGNEKRSVGEEKSERTGAAKREKKRSALSLL
jgi:hypothetical protein